MVEGWEGSTGYDCYFAVESAHCVSVLSVGDDTRFVSCASGLLDYCGLDVAASIAVSI